MKEREQSLRIPGPIALPPQIRREMGKQVINHRGPEFADRIWSVTEKLKKIYETEHDVLVLTASGTGGMEAAIVNTISPGSEVLSLSMGDFGRRFAEIAATYGAAVTQVEVPDGQAITSLETMPAFTARERTKPYDAVLITHNETSTGVTNDLEPLVRGIKRESPSTLVIIDAVSSIPSIPLKTDEWGCDVVISASQKGWGAPPGLTFVSMSPQAWESYERSDLPKNYFDLGKAKKFLENGQTPFTPAVLEIGALNRALDMISDEGHENFIERHRDIAAQVRKALKEMGLRLFADQWHASDTVTSVLHHRPKDVVKRARWSGLELAGGQGKLAGSIFRIGHMGFHTAEEMKEDLEIIASVI